MRSILLLGACDGYGQGLDNEDRFAEVVVSRFEKVRGFLILVLVRVSAASWTKCEVRGEAEGGR